ncbi:zinc finger protein 678-like [Lytechinus variegatus]|uniref:zinc finger protein 678-like n=1 Tax=Lytechinus variegatus TaxID=7654 RepID=UPI001BB105B7|nr:zinc finger protein 678-like [Lytechinus variegatus]
MEMEDECAGDDYTDEKNDDDTTERKEMEIDPSEERKKKFVEEPENTNSDDFCDTKDTGDGLHSNEMVVLLSEGELKFVIKQEPEDTDGHTNVNRCDSFLPSVHRELQSFIKEKPVDIEEERLISNTKEESADSYEGSFLHEPQLCSNQGGNPSIQCTSQGTGNTGDISGDTSCDRSHGKHLQEEVPLQFHLGNQSDLTERESSSSSESLLPNKVDSPEGESATTSSSVLNSDGKRLDGNTDSRGNKFCCSICNEEFKSRDCWWSHVKIHWEDKSYKCTYCEERFRKHNDLRNHLTIHAEERLQVSDKLFDDDSNLQSSVVVYINEKQDHCSSKDKSSEEDACIEKYYKCSSCEWRFQSSAALERHMASHLECFSCKKVFAKFDQLKYHIMMSHKGENPSVLRPNKCSVCKKSYHTLGDLKSHMGIHKEKVQHQCSVCKQSYHTLGELKSHMRIHKEKMQYQCSVCEAAFFRLVLLNAHMRMHTEERQYECSECKEVFHRADLRMHVRSHDVEWPKKCSLCDDNFTSWARLIDHRLKHTGEKPYLCSICKEDFTRKVDVDQHMEIHTQEKPSDMNKNTRERLFECTQCKKTFFKAHCLKRHIRTHTGEEPCKCAECGECFSFWGQLRIHKIKHTGIKPYLCSICGKNFWQKRQLSDHMKNHTGERPYICSFCSKSFKSKAYLRSHILRCH